MMTGETTAVRVMRYRSNGWLLGFGVLLAAARTSWAVQAAAPARAGEDPVICASIGDLVSPNDYRLRDSTPQTRWGIQDVTHNHYDPAVQRMSQGEYSRRVMADLDFLLRHWPNDLPGLEALIRYELAGGKAYEFAPAFCYLERARAFAPDDVGVLLHEGYYFWKKKNNDRAIEIFKAALAIDPTSADAHYDLGLIYSDLGEYDQAVAHARVAYDAGYPLPGLKHKLQQTGHWTEAQSQ